LPSARRPDGETDDHTSLRTRRSGFESWSGYWPVPSFSGQDIPVTWERSLVRIQPGLLMDGVCGVTVCMRPCEGRGGGFDSPRTPLNRSVLLGEQAVSKAARQGSNPCAPAFCRCGSIEKGSGPVNRLMLVRIQPSALECPGGVTEQHRTLLKSGSRFESGPGYCHPRGVADRTRPCEGRGSGSTPDEDT
jgi:hypothetical protein